MPTGWGILQIAYSVFQAIFIYSPKQKSPFYCPASGTIDDISQIFTIIEVMSTLTDFCITRKLSCHIHSPF